MTIPLVVGIDGSESSLEAVDWAVAEAARHSLSLHLLHAAAGDREPSDVISAASERAGARVPTVQLSCEVLHEDAATALVDRGRNAFALVLGSRGLGDLAEMLLGAVSLAVAARADCPVVVVRGTKDHREDRFGNIVVGVEGGESMRHGLAVRAPGGPGTELPPDGGARLEPVVQGSHPRAGTGVVRPGDPSAPAVPGTRRRPAQHDPPGSRRPSEFQGDRGPGAPSIATRGLGCGPAGRRRTQKTGAPGAAARTDQSCATASRAVPCCGRAPDMTARTAACGEGPVRRPVDGDRKPARQGLSALSSNPLPLDRGEQTVRTAGEEMLEAEP